MNTPPSTAATAGGIDAEHQRLITDLALDALLSSVNYNIWWKGVDGRFLGCNEQCAVQHGFDSPEELIGLTNYDVPLPDGAADRFTLDDKMVVETRTPIKDRIATVKQPDGDYHTALSKVPLVDGNDEVVGVLCVSTDITSHIRAEQQQVQERNLLDQILANIPYGIVWKDSEGRYLGINPAYRQMVGLDPDQSIEGVRTDNLPWTPPQGRSATEAEDEAVLTSGINRLRAPEHVVDDNGHHRDLEVSRIALTRDDGSTSGLLTIYADQTQMRALETKVAETSKLEAIGQLASGVAHEINTPIQYVGDNLDFLSSSSSELVELLSTAVGLASKVLSGDDASQEAEALLADFERADVEYLSEEIPRAVEQSLEGTDRVRTIVRALKDFAHPGTETPEPTDVNRVIESTVSVATNEWKYVADVVFDLDPELPLVECQPGQLGQVVLILVVNAAHAVAARHGKAAEKGRIEIGSRAEGTAVEIVVTDNGTGIPADVLPRIFEPFYTTKDVGKGTGQGLSLAHSIVHRDHGGTLTVKTEVGTGTSFIVSIPQVAATTDEADDDGHPST